MNLQICHYCEQPAGHEPGGKHLPSCRLFEPEWDPDEMPAAPYNDFVERPKTRAQEVRATYLEAMYAAAVSRWCRRKGKIAEADSWWETFEQHRELVADLDKSLRNPPEGGMPSEKKWSARDCLTAGCSGVFWFSNLDQWLARGHGQPLSGLCPKCERERDRQ